MAQIPQLQETVHVLVIGPQPASLHRALEELRLRYPALLITAVNAPELAEHICRQLSPDIIVAVVSKPEDSAWVSRLSVSFRVVVCLASDPTFSASGIEGVYAVIRPDELPDRLLSLVEYIVQTGPSTLPAAEKDEVDFFTRQNQAFLQLITSPIFTGGDLQEALSTITRLAADLLGVARVSVWHLLEDRPVLQCLWTFDRDRPGDGISEIDLRAFPLYRQAIETNRVVVARNVSRTPETAELTSSYWDVLGIQASIDVPIRVRGRVAGVVCCEHRGGPRDWRPEEVTLAGHLADLIAQVFLYAENERRVREVTLLSRMISATALAEDLQTAMEHVCAELAHFFGAPQAAFALLNPEGTAAQVIAEYRRPDRPSGLNEVIPVEGNPSMAYVLEHRQPLAISDAQHDPILAPVHDLMRRRGTVSLLLIPIIVGRRVVGTLGIDMIEPATFRQEDLALAQHVATLIGQTLERLNLLANLKKQTRQLTKLSLLGERLNRPLNLDDVVSAIGEGVLELTGADRAAVFLWNEDEPPRCVWTHNLPPNYPELVVANLEKLPGLLVKTQGLPFMISDVEQAANYPFLRELARAFHYRALGILPLVYEDQPIGAISCYFASPHIWSEDEAQILYAFARQAATALKNAYLFDTERRRRSQLEALRQASLQLTSSLNLKDVLESIVQHVTRLSGSDDVHLFLLEGDKLRFGAAMWGGKLQEKPLEEPRSHGVTYTVARTGRRLVIPFVNRHPLYHDWPWGGAIASFPLRSGPHVVGVLNVAFQHPHTFTEEELHVLELLADQAAIAVQNARLVQSLEERVNQLSAIARASTALRGAADVEEIAATVVEHALHFVGADAAVLYLVDEEQQEAVPVSSAGLAEPPKAVSLERSIVGHVNRAQEPYRTDDLAHNSLAACGPIWKHMGPGLCIPLRTTNGHIVGTLTIARRQGAPSFTADEESLLNTLAEIAANALQRALSHAELEAAYLQTALALARAVDVRDTYTSDHSERMARLAVAVARQMGLDEETVNHIRLAALLHDIGKIGVPDAILRKPGPLNEEEWAIMKTHPEIGAEIVAPIRKLHPVVEIILAHQERYDGTGYPRGLKGEEIPLGARILAVVDAYSAMTENRVYRKARSPEEAIAELKRCAGTHFDPQVVQAFLRVWEAFPNFRMPEGVYGADCEDQKT